MSKSILRLLLTTTCAAAFGAVGVQASHAADAVPVYADGIGGVVTGPKGPEAGVWVIAETHDLATRMIKIVVTDDQGRFMLPDMPKAKYDVWVRGYGLVDSNHAQGTPGKNMNFTAIPAPDAKTAAEIYPANYWYALIQPPPASDFPGTGPKGNGIAPTMMTQQMWLSQMKDGCGFCHQQGDKTTRTLLDNTPEGWAERITKQRPDGDHVLGDHGKDFAAFMGNTMTSFGRQRALTMWSDWTKRIADGALPKEAPPRPSGIERNLVLTSWDWANGRYVHDNISTDRHNPTVNANGPIYGVIGMAGYIEALDPITGKQKEVGYKVNLNKNVELLPENKVPDAFPHNPMMDKKGRIWITDLGRFGGPAPNQPPPPDKLPYCSDPAYKFAKYFPQPGKARNTAVVYDPKANTIDGVFMCNGMHHLMASPDSKWMYFSGGDNKVVSWVDMDTWDATKDQAKSQGWCPMVLDTNSTKAEEFAGVNEVAITPDQTQWNQPAVLRGNGMGGEEGANNGAVAAVKLDPKKDTRVEGFLYGIDASVSDGAMWFAKTGPFPTQVVRFHPGNNPPETCKTEMYEPTKLPDGKSYIAFDGRGVSVDSKGVTWIAYGSGNLGRFDRSKCKIKSGPTVAAGQHCPEGWSVLESPGPKMAGINAGSADFHYLNWVDLHDTLGMGKDTPLFAGTNSDSLLAVDQKTMKVVILRVPYPISFHTRGMDGRIDDGSKGWKGKGVLATYATEPVWHQEGGEDASGPQLVKFQMRPDPLAN